MKIPVIFVFVTPAFITCISCRSTITCEEPPDVNQSALVVNFKDQATGQYLYSELNPLYNKDSIKILDPSGNSLLLNPSLVTIPNSNDRFYQINFGDIYNSQTDEAAFTAEICKSFIVFYDYNETDTIQTCLKAKKVRCGSVFETLKVYHKGRLLSTVNNETFAIITINKN